VEATAAPAERADSLREAVTEKPLVEITGGRVGITRATFSELWAFREVVLAFALRSVKVRYKQAAIGVAWAVLQPMAAAALFAVFLGRLSHIGSEGVPYLLFALTGMAAWSYFSSGAASAMDSLVENSSVLRKVYFPREALPLAAVLAGLVDLLPSLATLIAVAALYGVYPDVAWLALPLPMLLAIMTATALGLAVSGINVYYRDVRYALPFALQIGLFASPVVYSLSIVPEGWRTAYGILNPLAATIDSLRRIVLHGEWPQPAILGGAFAWVFLLLAAAYVLFKRLERGFADRI
jgi:homopolymeric O-antigen transport system permease protein